MESERAADIDRENQQLALEARASKLVEQLSARLDEIQATGQFDSDQYLLIEVGADSSLIRPELKGLESAASFIEGLGEVERLNIRRITDMVLTGKTSEAQARIKELLPSSSQSGRAYLTNMLANITPGQESRVLREKLLSHEGFPSLPTAVIADVVLTIASDARLAEQVLVVVREILLPTLSIRDNRTHVWLKELEKKLMPSAQAELSLLLERRLEQIQLFDDFMQEDRRAERRTRDVAFFVSRSEPHFVWWREDDNRFSVLKPEMMDVLRGFLVDESFHLASVGAEDKELRVPLKGVGSGFALFADLRSPENELPWRTLSIAAFLLFGGGVLVLGFRREQRAIEESKQTLDAKSAFLANVSHQLKTPVTNLRMFAETLSQPDLDSEEDRQRMLHILSDESERLGSYLHRILANARLEGTEWERSRFDLGDLIDERLEHWQKTSAVFGVGLRVSLADDLPEIEGDRTGFADALDNLVENALAFTPRGGQVEVFGSHKGNEIEMAVTDEGPGIPEDEQERVFERFYRGEHARARQGIGTGLGLFIARAGIERARGTLKVGQSSASGTTMEIRVAVGEGKTHA